MDKRIGSHYPHGLGDCAGFAALLKLYVDHGYDVEIDCGADKQFTFAASGVKIQHTNHTRPHPYEYCNNGETNYGDMDVWEYNKTAQIIKSSKAVFPPLFGSQEECWKALCAIQMDLAPLVPQEAFEAAQRILEGLPKPVVLIHTKGNTLGDRKNIPDDQHHDLYRAIINRGGSLLLLDWDNRVPSMNSWRVRHVQQEWGKIDVPTLVSLIDQADAITGIDSGPTHLARWTQTPVIGLWHTHPCYPGAYALPNPRQVNIVRKEWSHAANLKSMCSYNIIEDDSKRGLTAELVADVIYQMISAIPGKQGDEVWLRWLVSQTAGTNGDGIKENVDRHLGFKYLLNRIGAGKSIVETGCMRAPDDWRGAGMSTYLLGAFTTKVGGSVTSVDINATNLEFAKSACREFPNSSFVEMDSVEYLRTCTQEVAYLDSLDTDQPGHEEHGLREMQVLPSTVRLVAFDDSPYVGNGKFGGKGALAIPWALENGWVIEWSGYQTILARK